MVLLLSGLGGCGGDASSGGGGIEIGGASGTGRSLIALPAGECVWAMDAYEIAWVDYDDNDTPIGLRGSMEGISPLTIGRNCTDAGCAIVDHEGTTRFRIEFNLTVSCESDPNDPCVAE